MGKVNNLRWEMRSMILVLLGLLMLQPIYGRRVGRLRAMNDSLASEVARLNGVVGELDRVRGELAKTQLLLQQERRERMKIGAELRADLTRAVGITAAGLALVFLLALVLVVRSNANGFRRFAIALESARNQHAPPVAPPAAVVAPESPERSSGNGRSIPEKPAAKPAPAVPILREAAPEIPPVAPPIIQPAAAAAPVPGQTSKHPIFWFTREEPASAKVTEMIDLLRQRGITAVAAGQITRETIREMEQGAYDALLCAYEPRNEQGIMIDKNLQGVINALSFSGTLTPLIILIDPRDQQISSWDQHMINSYDFATVTTSRLAFINQVVLSLQTAKTAA